MCTLASTTGVVVPSGCWIAKAVLRCHPADVSTFGAARSAPDPPSVKRCSSIARIWFSANRLPLRRSGCVLISRWARGRRNGVVESRERLQHLRRMLFSGRRDKVPGGLVLLEFDDDQRLWQETVRDAVTKQCPASLVRSIAETASTRRRCGRPTSMPAGRS